MVDPYQLPSQEDSMKNSYLGRPTHNDYHALHPKEHDSLSKRIWDCRDVFHDHHAEFLMFIKACLKGAIAATTLGGLLAISFSRHPGIVWQKINNYVEIVPFGGVKIWAKMLRPLAVSGAVIGGAGTLFWNKFWTKGSQQSPMFDYIFGFSIMTSVSAAALFHPRLYSLGALFGGLGGWWIYQMKFANLSGHKKTTGFVMQIPGLTPEQREKQEYKDYIASMSLEPQIRYSKLSQL